MGRSFFDLICPVQWLPLHFSTKIGLADQNRTTVHFLEVIGLLFLTALKRVAFLHHEQVFRWRCEYEGSGCFDSFRFWLRLLLAQGNSNDHRSKCLLPMSKELKRTEKHTAGKGKEAWRVIEFDPRLRMFTQLKPSQLCSLPMPCL